MNIIILHCTSLYSYPGEQFSACTEQITFAHIVPSFCKYDFFAHCMYLKTTKMLVGLDRGMASREGQTCMKASYKIHHTASSLLCARPWQHLRFCMYINSIAIKDPVPLDLLECHDTVIVMSVTSLMIHPYSQIGISLIERQNVYGTFDVVDPRSLP